MRRFIFISVAVLFVVAALRSDTFGRGFGGFGGFHGGGFGGFHAGGYGGGFWRFSRRRRRSRRLSRGQLRRGRRIPPPGVFEGGGYDAGSFGARPTDTTSGDLREAAITRAASAGRRIPRRRS